MKLGSREIWVCVFVAAALIWGGHVVRAQTKLEPYLEVELERIEETYALLNAYAQKIWPGWNNYPDVESVPESYILKQGFGL